VILTHCNSQAAISVIIHAKKQGKRLRVFVTETRPKMQGLLTAAQLSKEGIPTTLIIDSAVRFFMPKIDKVIVGADAIAANGAVINKIGTSMIALAAHEARVRLMVAAETYKFSPETVLGELIEIEERPAEEVVSREWLKRFPNVSVRNPAFDVTPPEYVDIIITEVGVVSPQSYFLLVRDMFGWVYGMKEPWA
ncbi:ribose 1,5-bisphosphate isomerase, partial [Candidatus Geothermarchaeota archaeon]